MRLAFGAGAVVGVLAPAVGFFLVQRRMSLIGDGIGHVAFAGVALGYLLGIAPVATALVASVAGAITVEWLRANARPVTGSALLFYRTHGRRRHHLVGGGRANATFRVPVQIHPDRHPRRPPARRGDGRAGPSGRPALPRPRRRRALDEEGARGVGFPLGTLNVVVGLAGVTIRSRWIVGILLIAALMVRPVTRRTTRAQRRLGVRASGIGPRLRFVADDLVLRRPRPRRRDRARRRRSLRRGGDRRTPGIPGLSTVVPPGLRIRKTEPVATMRDVEKLALAMPGATKALDDEGRPSYSVHERFFCFIAAPVGRGRRGDRRAARGRLRPARCGRRGEGAGPLRSPRHLLHHAALERLQRRPDPHPGPETDRPPRAGRPRRWSLADPRAQA